MNADQNRPSDDTKASAPRAPFSDPLAIADFRFRVLGLRALRAWSAYTERHLRARATGMALAESQRISIARTCPQSTVLTRKRTSGRSSTLALVDLKQGVRSRRSPREAYRELRAEDVKTPMVSKTDAEAEAEEEQDLGLADKFGRAVARTAAVNAAILCTGPVGGYAAGSAITAKRVHDGAEANDVKEVSKGVAVYGAATTGSCVGQIVGGVIGGACAGPVGVPIGAFTAGCLTGITVGALSEVAVDKLDEHDALPAKEDLQPLREFEKSVKEKTHEFSKFITTVVEDHLHLLKDASKKPVIEAMAANVFDLPAPKPRGSIIAGNSKVKVSKPKVSEPIEV